jgi:nitrogen regulatory protein P-II 1
MKKIECIIREDRVKELREALRLKGVGGMTLTHVQGFGRETTRPTNYLLLPKVKIEIYCTKDQVDDYVETIMNTCRTGELGDGKIAVLDLDNIVRIRTAEEKEAAIL